MLQDTFAVYSDLLPSFLVIIRLYIRLCRPATNRTHPPSCEADSSAACQEMLHTLIDPNIRIPNSNLHSHSISLRNTLILCSLLSQGLPGGFFPPPKSHMHFILLRSCYMTHPHYLPFPPSTE